VSGHQHVGVKHVGDFSEGAVASEASRGFDAKPLGGRQGSDVDRGDGARQAISLCDLADEIAITRRGRTEAVVDVDHVQAATRARDHGNEGVEEAQRVGATRHRDHDRTARAHESVSPQSLRDLALHPTDEVSARRWHREA
jgi:hypothetical protein